MSEEKPKDVTGAANNIESPRPVLDTDASRVSKSKTLIRTSLTNLEELSRRMNEGAGGVESKPLMADILKDIQELARLFHIE